MIIHNPILTGSLTLNNVNLSTGNLVTTGSNTFVGNQILSGSLTVSGSVSATGTLTAQTLVVQTVTSSVIYSSGSNVFGNSLANNQIMTGSVLITGSVGIGTTSPSTLLHINSIRTSGTNVNTLTLSDNVTGAQTAGYGLRIQYLSNNSGVKAAIGLENGNTGTNNESQISFYTQNAANALAQSMVLTSTGNLQVGTVLGGTATSTPINISLGSTFGNNPTGSNFKLKLFEDNVPNIYGLGVSNQMLEVIAGSSGNIAFFTNGANEKMRITSAGNVGIGTTTAGSRLTVRGTDSTSMLYLGISGSSSNGEAVGITFGSATYDKARIVSYNENSGNAAGYLTFWTGGSPATTDVTERMRIKSDGRVYVGGNTISNSPLFGVIGSGVWDAGCIGLSNTGTGGIVYTIFSTNSSFGQGASNLLFYNTTNATNNLIIYSNGNYDFLGSDVSDRRLKQDIEDLNYGLTEIMALSPKSYHLKSEDNLQGDSQTTLRKRYGFIAQEIQTILPDTITGEETENDYLGLDYNGVLAVAVKAIQELKAEFDEYKTTHP